jgi:hypothetical protein
MPNEMHNKIKQKQVTPAKAGAHPDRQLGLLMALITAPNMAAEHAL